MSTEQCVCLWSISLTITPSLTLRGACTVTSDLVFAEISVRSLRKSLLSITSQKLIGSKYPRNLWFSFEKQITARNGLCFTRVVNWLYAFPRDLLHIIGFLRRVWRLSNAGQRSSTRPVPGSVGYYLAVILYFLDRLMIWDTYATRRLPLEGFTIARIRNKARTYRGVH